MTTQSFTCFGKLPPELRTQIYILATPPRVVFLQKRALNYHDFVQEYTKREGTEPRGNYFSHRRESEAVFIYSRTTIPVLLHTCRESRSEMVKHGYELTFGTESTSPRTWFNYRWDALYLTEHFGRIFIPPVNRPGAKPTLLREDKKRPSAKMEDQHHF
ncbi:hypothetical protein FSST1_009667 [Fusarium sambucinum]